MTVRPRVPHNEASRAEQYRDLLETWAAWWNNIARYSFPSDIRPPITATGEALHCLACKGVGPYEAETGPKRCQVCLRRMP